jgi:hypothetical protein
MPYPDDLDLSRSEHVFCCEFSKMSHLDTKIRPPRAKNLLEVLEKNFKKKELQMFTCEIPECNVLSTFIHILNLQSFFSAELFFSASSFG